MKILFFLSAGNGDLINFTGPLAALHEERPDLVIDFLVPRKNSYILEHNPAINKILIMEDYDVPGYCRDPQHSIKIKNLFSKFYDKVINAWAVEHYTVHRKNEYHLDYTALAIQTLASNGLNITKTRKDCNGIMYCSATDEEIVDNLYSTFKSTKPLVLVESISFSYKSPNLPLVQNTVMRLKELGYAVCGNDNSFDLNTSSLNLKQIKLFFTKYCEGFCGISSGISCAICSEPTDFSSKKLIFNGLWPSWDLFPFFKNKPLKYHFGVSAYKDAELIKVFEK